MPVFDRIPVHTASPYTVTVGQDIVSESGEWLRDLHAPCTVQLVTDDTVNTLYADTVEHSLTAAGFTVHRFVFPHGESSKTTATLVTLLERMAEQEITRQDVVAALGGGVVSDLAGFAAAVYLRGIPHVTFPTTLLSAVDAAVGGKTGVDLAAGKNLAGAFKQPLGVLCDTATFATLPPREIRNGMAETVKTAMLCDTDLFASLENAEDLDLTAAVARCIRYKAYVVEQDERDQGLRQLLNLGHTVGHAIEQCSDYTLAHGEAVAIGMAVIARAAARRGLCTDDTAARLICTLEAHGLPTGNPYTAEELRAVAMRDKKRRGDRLTLIVPLTVGECVLHDIPTAELAAWITEGSTNQ
ncbi:MAG: 3-dehydroquinate synthase [Ruminococcaceae bacterium]|nr:3-dehydroquinate synthase [Oscillospiraceae bacterium]